MTVLKPLFVSYLGSLCMLCQRKEQAVCALNTFFGGGSPVKISNLCLLAIRQIGSWLTVFQGRLAGVYIPALIAGGEMTIQSCDLSSYIFGLGERKCSRMLSLASNPVYGL